MRLRHLVSLQEAEAPEESVARFAAVAGSGLAGLEPGDVSEHSLALVFALSAWLRMAGVGTAGACEGFLGLRRALLTSSGLDSSSEPVPLLTGEPRNTLLSLALYVHGLIRRCARHRGTSCLAVVEEALHILR